MKRRRFIPLLLLAALSAAPLLAAASAVRELDARDQHIRFFYDERDAVQSEWVSLAPEITGELAALPMGSRVQLREFPVAPGQRLTVALERIDIYAPGARVVVVSADGEAEIPPSNKIRLLGRALDDPAVRIGLWVEADGSSMKGIASTASGLHQIERVTGEESTYEIGVGAVVRKGGALSLRCDTDDPIHESKLIEMVAPMPERLDLPVNWQLKSASHSAVVIFDTDGELIDNMYGGSTAAAGEGIADWLTAANVIYERDPQLRLMQGDTVLRDNPATDPWTTFTTTEQLTEFGDYYAANMGSVDRVFAVFLSGKSTSANSGSGRSWIDSYCEKQSYGGSYSVTMVIRAVALDHAANVRLLVHEIGHTAGSVHTHCYSPNIDQCHNGQCGTANCYCGSTLSCPNHSAVLPIPSGQGTLMSYCHMSDASSANCGSNASYFHPTVAAHIHQRMLDNVGSGCVQSIEPTYPTLSVTKSGDGSGVVTSSPAGIYCGGTCDSPFLPGATLSLTAHPDPGSAFTGWSGHCSGLLCAMAMPLSGARAVNATFVDISIFSDGFETGTTARWSSAEP